MRSQRRHTDKGLNQSFSSRIGKAIFPGLKYTSLIAGIITALIGMMVLFGWIIDEPFLKSLHADFNSMKANTSISFILLGLALLLFNQSKSKKRIERLAQVFILITLFINLITIAEYLFNRDPGFDEFLFKDIVQGDKIKFPGRIAFNTSLSFLFLGFAMFFAKSDSIRLKFLSQLLSFTTALISFIPLLGYIYGTEQLLTFAFFNTMALHTAICFLILSMGVISLIPESWPLSVITLQGPGGYMVRRLLPMAFLIPILILWVHLLRKAELMITSADLLFLSLIYIGIFALFIWLVARKVNALDHERMVSQEAIRASEARFRSTLDNMMEGCQLIGYDWRYLYINAAAEVHNRRPKSELIGNVYTEMWPGIENTVVYRNLKDCMINRVATVMKNEFVYPDGKTGWFDLRIQAVPEGIFILSTDITGSVQSELHNQLEIEVMKYLNRFSDSGKMISEIINVIKAKTGIEAIGIRLKQGNDYPYFRTEGFSDQFVNAERYLCSYDKDGNVILDENNKPQLDCMCGNILSGRVDTSKSFFTRGGSFRSNNTTRLLAETTEKDRLARTRNRCNSSGYESVALIPLRAGSDVIGLLQLNDHRCDMFNDEIIPLFEKLGSSIAIAIMRNNAETELQKLNEELERRIDERTEQLMDSNRELEAFAYSVSHDLRAPLRHIMGFSQKLENLQKEKTDSERIRLTGIIKHSAFQMGVLIDELLSYSRLGRTELVMMPNSLKPIIEEVISKSDDMTENRSIEWKIAGLPHVMCDKTLIKLVFQNLIQNSLKFTRNKEKTIIEIGYERQDDAIYQFHVKDNGAGFDNDYSDKLFGVFQRLHTEEEFEGTGIGLAIVKRIIARHGGMVWADGKVDEGATFYFTLPIASQRNVTL